jgi:hypothetical protein
MIRGRPLCEDRAAPIQSRAPSLDFGDFGSQSKPQRPGRGATVAANVQYSGARLGEMKKMECRDLVLLSLVALGLTLPGCLPESGETESTREDASARDVSLAVADMGALDAGPETDARTASDMGPDLAVETDGPPAVMDTGVVEPDATRDARPPPEPLPEDCDDACDEQARRSLESCIMSGMNPAACAELIGRRQGECHARCPGEPSGPCQEACGAANMAAVAACVARGGREDECREENRLDGVRCLSDCASEEAGEDCQARCARRAQAVYDDCRAHGGNAAFCAGERDAEAERCAPDCAGRAGPCQAACRADAERNIRACLASGRPDDLCRRTFEPLVAPCAGRCAICEPNCPQQARAAEDACLELGEAPANCEARLDAAWDACMRIWEGRGP